MSAAADEILVRLSRQQIAYPSFLCASIDDRIVKWCCANIGYAPKLVRKWAAHPDGIPVSFMRFFAAVRSDEDAVLLQLWLGKDG